MQLNCWMSFISDTKLITELTIPGTHNSGCIYDAPALPDTTKTQSLSIAEQLNIGVRFFDIRCKIFNDKLVLFNGLVNQKLNLETVLEIFQKFLLMNSSETIIIELRDESYPLHNPQNFEYLFNKILKSYSELFFLENRFPALKEVRGKVVLLRNFEVNDITRKGIDKKEKVRNYSILKQNHYKEQTTEQKWHYIKQFLFNAKKDSKTVFYMNYTSGYKKTMFLGLPSIKKISDTINPLLKGFLKLSSNARYGAVIMDHINIDYSSHLVAMNFPKEKVDGVIFFEDINLNGTHTLPVPEGRYSLSDLQKFGFNSSSISSLVLPENWEIKMFEKDFFSGNSWSICKNDEQSCNFSKFGYDTPNNKVSSVIIYKHHDSDNSISLSSSEESFSLLKNYKPNLST